MLKLVDQLPDTEFYLNTRDWPQTSKWNSNLKLPVFSFSKVVSKRVLLSITSILSVLFFTNQLSILQLSSLLFLNSKAFLKVFFFYSNELNTFNIDKGSL